MSTENETWGDYSKLVLKELERLKNAILLGDEIAHTEILGYIDANIAALSAIVDKNDVKLNSVDITEKIVNPNQQKLLVKEFMTENKMTCEWELIDRLDNKVNNELYQNSQQMRFNNWKIKKLEFSNFLSFGDNNEIDFENIDGITVIESNPENFGGKTTSSVDLLLFLFFGKTTKTKTNIEIFNLYRDTDEVFVKGLINIDNDDYIIVRKIERKKSKSGDYNVTNVLDFFKINTDGTMENLKGEQRKETEKFITEAIGSEEDFLATILTTGGNLEDLIESKPTARGQILTKFLGLEIFKEKEEIAKKMYSDWSKKLISNTHNIVDLQNDNETLEKNIQESNELITQLKTDLINHEADLEISKTKRDKLFLSRNNDIDKDLLNVNPELIEREINGLKTKKDSAQKSADNVDVKEPEKFYLETDHDKHQKEYNDILVEKSVNEKNIQTTKNLILNLEKGEICPTCKRKLDEVDHSDEIAKLNDDLSKFQKIDFVYVIQEKLSILSDFKELKTQYDTYEKNKLIKAKYEFEVEQINSEIDKKNKRLDEYEKNKKKLEDNKKIDEELISLKSKIDTIEGNIRITNTNIERSKNNIQVCNDEIEVNNKLIKTIKSEEEYVNVFKTYLTIFGKNGISKVVLKNMVPVLNNELYRILNDSCFFTLELNVNDKNEVEFLMIDNETRLVKSLSTGSGYEKTISSLALRSVLTKISSLPKPNIVVMDEVFGKIADANLELVGMFFKKIKEYFQHIFLISHNPLIRNWSDNILLIKKDNNISSIESIKTINT
jgi:DNA repair exonuclease SbcCD ATPase subunit